MLETESFKKAAKTAAEGMLYFYHGDQPGYVPGDFEQDDIYWWTCGAMFMSVRQQRSRFDDTEDSR
jgi:mannan endo-1,6-alpha-mannosidase